jgi:hypothetical protein
VDVLLRARDRHAELAEGMDVKLRDALKFWNVVALSQPCVVPLALGKLLMSGTAISDSRT